MEKIIFSEIENERYIGEMRSREDIRNEKEKRKKET